jgi:hypothetical protein
MRDKCLDHSLSLPARACLSLSILIFVIMAAEREQGTGGVVKQNMGELSYGRYMIKRHQIV